jgi:hypothetical protein
MALAMLWSRGPFMFRIRYGLGAPGGLHDVNGTTLWSCRTSMDDIAYGAFEQGRTSRFIVGDKR